MRLLLATFLLAAAFSAPTAMAPAMAAKPASTRSGAVAMSLTLRTETDAAWKKLAALGWVTTNELRVMVKGEGGHKNCIAVYEGTIPAANVAAARKLPEVGSLQPRLPGR